MGAVANWEAPIMAISSMLPWADGAGDESHAYVVSTGWANSWESERLVPDSVMTESIPPSSLIDVIFSSESSLFELVRIGATGR
jgi:hypothetical protein